MIYSPTYCGEPTVITNLPKMLHLWVRSVTGKQGLGRPAVRLKVPFLHLAPAPG